MKMKKSNSISRLVPYIAFLAIVILANSCSSGDSPAPVPPVVVPPVVVPPVVVPTFAGPTYADNYSSIAAWGSNSQWNLANVHDPTVEKCGDYYYMYQTDASYGNSTDGHGHFFYRRSKDLQ
jgi:arabinan endo-1,5-alpha-L-arabinosidase